jgi:hypothetical protein
MGYDCFNIGAPTTKSNSSGEPVKDYGQIRGTFGRDEQDPEAARDRDADTSNDVR